MERRLGKRLLFSDIQSKRGNQQDGLRIPAARILWDFNFLRQLALDFQTEGTRRNVNLSTFLQRSLKAE